MSTLEDMDNYELNSENRGSDSEAVLEDADAADNDDDAGQEEVYYVEAILGKKVEGGQLYYNVKWQGYSADQSTWEPEENLYAVKDMIAAFEKQVHIQKKSFMLEEEPSEGSEEEEEPVHRTKKKLKKNDQNASVREKSRSAEPKSKSTEQKGSAKPRGTSILKENRIPTIGHLRYRDKPKQIVSLRTTNQPDLILFRVKWEQRANGVLPGESYISNEEFMKYNPRFLLAFYQSKLKLANTPDTSEKQNKNQKKNVDEAMDIEYQDEPSLRANIEPERVRVVSKKDVSCQASNASSNISSPKSVQIPRKFSSELPKSTVIVTAPKEQEGTEQREADSDPEITKLEATEKKATVESRKSEKSTNNEGNTTPQGPANQSAQEINEKSNHSRISTSKPSQDIMPEDEVPEEREGEAMDAEEETNPEEETPYLLPSKQPQVSNSQASQRLEETELAAAEQEHFPREDIADENNQSADKEDTPTKLERSLMYDDEVENDKYFLSKDASATAKETLEAEGFLVSNATDSGVTKEYGIE